MNFITSHPFAKLNLRLKITGKRPSDGYHMLDMVTIATRFEDTLEVSMKKGSGRIDLQMGGAEAPGQLPVEENLCYRAAALFAQTYNISNDDISIRLEKNIPSGAGLGGGSSDAAFTLLSLKELFHLTRDISVPDLASLSLSLGSDLPYFFTGGLARVGGIGEEVRRLEIPVLENLPCALFFPEESIPTPVIYRLFREKQMSSGHYSAQMDDAYFREPFEYDTFLSLIENDLEDVVCEYSARTGNMLALLRGQKNVVSSVTGSGSTIFALPGLESMSQSEFELQIKEIAQQYHFKHLLTSLTCKCPALSPL